MKVGKDMVRSSDLCGTVKMGKVRLRKVGIWTCSDCYGQVGVLEPEQLILQQLCTARNERC